jgi:hypothetical protein
MSPKKTPRGGRYTTGIKRTGSGGYGGQSTGRRGCMVMALLSLFILAGPVVGACSFWIGMVAR